MGCGHSVLLAKLAFQTTYHFINNDELGGSLSMDRTADTIIISISLINIRTTQTNTRTFIEK